MCTYATEPVKTVQLCSRGMCTYDNERDKIVNQFLSMIDGPESLNNILENKSKRAGRVVS